MPKKDLCMLKGNEPLITCNHLLHGTIIIRAAHHVKSTAEAKKLY